MKEGHLLLLRCTPPPPAINFDLVFFFLPRLRCHFLRGWHIDISVWSISIFNTVYVHLRAKGFSLVFGIVSHLYLVSGLESAPENWVQKGGERFLLPLSQSSYFSKMISRQNNIS